MTQERTTPPATFNLSPSTPFAKATAIIDPIIASESGTGINGKDGKERLVKKFLKPSLEKQNNVKAEEKTTIKASMDERGNIPLLTVLITRLSAEKNPSETPKAVNKNKTFIISLSTLMNGPAILAILFAPKE